MAPVAASSRLLLTYGQLQWTFAPSPLLRCLLRDYCRVGPPSLAANASQRLSDVYSCCSAGCPSRSYFKRGRAEDGSAILRKPRASRPAFRRLAPCSRSSTWSLTSACDSALPRRQWISYVGLIQRYNARRVVGCHRTVGCLVETNTFFVPQHLSLSLYTAVGQELLVPLAPYAFPSLYLHARASPSAGARAAFVYKGA